MMVTIMYLFFVPFINAAIFYYHAEIVGLFVIKYLNNSLEKSASTGYQEYKR